MKEAESLVSTVEAQWTLSEYVTLATLILAVIFLISLAIDYWINKDGPRKGGILISFLAIILLIAPGATNMVFKFAGGELTIENTEDIKKEQIQIIESNKLLEKRNNQLNSKLDSISRSIEINGKILAVVSKTFGSAKKIGAPKKEIEKLVEEQKEISSEIPDSFQKYKVSFKNIEFDGICETKNNTGEFFYTFFINGDSVVHRSLQDRIKKKKGDIQDLSGYSKVIQETQRNDTFNFNGFVKEYDGKTFFRNKLKITPVGSVEKAYKLQDADLLIPFGVKEKQDCRATLKLQVKKI